MDLKDSGRVDKLISNQLDFSRTDVQNWIDEGRVKVENKTVGSRSKQVSPGQVVEVNIPDDAGEKEVEPEAGPLEIIYEDQDILAVNKPSGMIVHPAPNIFTGTLVNRLLAHYPRLEEVGPPARAGLIHRLDRGTSGILLVARTNEMLERMQEEFKNRRVKKQYLAVLTGDLTDERLRVEVPVARDKNNPTLRVASPEGKQATTVFEKMKSDNKNTAVKAYPHTGRTHQIRIHSKYINHPVVGDRKYGGESANRLMLHAKKITFNHPKTGEKTTLQAPVPDEVSDLWHSIVN
ncbi:MAG: RluA family pseudouridine synthase [bacterium]